MLIQTSFFTSWLWNVWTLRSHCCWFPWAVGTKHICQSLLSISFPCLSVWRCDLLQVVFIKLQLISLLPLLINPSLRFFHTYRIVFDDFRLWIEPLKPFFRVPQTKCRHLFLFVHITSVVFVFLLGFYDVLQDKFPRRSTQPFVWQICL